MASRITFEERAAKLNLARVYRRQSTAFLYVKEQHPDIATCAQECASYFARKSEDLFKEVENMQI